MSEEQYVGVNFRSPLDTALDGAGNIASLDRTASPLPHDPSTTTTWEIN